MGVGFQLEGLFAMAKLSEYSSVIKCFLSAILFINFTLAMQCETFALPSANCTDASGIQMGICVDTHNDSLDILLQMQIANHSSTKQPGGSSLNSQRSLQTAEGSASSDAQAAGTRYLCDGVTREYSLPDGTAKKLGCLFSSARSGDDTAGVVPTTSEILYYAATTIHADGAGINKQPPTVSYTNRFVPTIVSVTSPTQTHVINLLGRDITITLTATNYEYSWGDGTPNTVTTSPGLAWEKGIDPNKDPRLIRHYYTPPQGWRSGVDGPYPHENREITLTTTWSGTATNPFTGETQTINGLVTTTETTGPFPLSHLVINNTDTWEEKQGH